MSNVIRNAKAQILSFNNDVDVINTLHQNFLDAETERYNDIQRNREIERENQEINLILQSAINELIESRYVNTEIPQLVRNDEPVFSGRKFNRPFTHLKTIVNYR